MARAPFTFVVPDGAQPGEVIQVQVLGILARVELPAGTFGGQQLTGTYSREAYGERWQAVLSDERETRRRRLESGKHVPVKSGNHEYDQYVVLSKRVLGQALGFEQCAGLVRRRTTSPPWCGARATAHPMVNTPFAARENDSRDASFTPLHPCRRHDGTDFPARKNRERIVVIE